ncbi:MAG: AAA family ATPase [Eubacteriales bacterium]|jgi:MoxR-like ATPase|nr:MoxR family ATPase [Clostridiales bacterium]
MDSEVSILKQEDLERLYDLTEALVGEIEKVVVGKHTEVILLVTALLAGGHVLIEDVPGVGKTTLAAALARAAGLKFRRAQFTPDVMASDITGFNIYNRRTERFEFKEGLVMTNILLADEINRASPKTQSSLLEAMEEARVTVDGVTYDVPDPFMVIATQNPAGFVGTYPLPEAQIDRFSLKISMGYPTLDEEIAIIDSRRTENPIDSVRPVAGVKAIQTLRTVVSNVHIDAEVSKYIVLLVSATRRHEKLALGASPRASLALMRISQAYAFMHRRMYVLPEDVAAVFRNTIAHRLMLKQEAKLERLTADDILTEILRRTDAPYKGKR